MDSEYVTIIFKIVKKDEQYDLSVPLYISANDLMIALNASFNLGVDVSNIKNCFLSAERPIALLRGEKTLKEHGIRNGSVISFTG